MNDTLDYFMKTPEERPSFYHKLTFSMMYFYNEHFILPFSHDEVVHGKKTIIDKMYGEYEEKFAQVKALYMYMFAHPGKKLNFMGNEIAMFREWDETKEPDWFLLKYPIHDSFLHFMRELNNIHLTHPSLSQYDFSEKGFKWVDCHQEQDCIYVFKRMSDKETIVAFFNFHNVDKTYTYKVDQPETLTLLLNSDNELYSGKSHNLDKEIHINNEIEMTLPAYSAQFYIVK